MKEQYYEAQLEVVEMEAVDVITTSGNHNLDRDELPPIVVG